MLTQLLLLKKAFSPASFGKHKNKHLDLTAHFMYKYTYVDEAIQQHILDPGAVPGVSTTSTHDPNREAGGKLNVYLMCVFDGDEIGSTGM